MNSDDNALSEIRKGLALLYEAGDIVELRAFHQTHLDYPTTISGFFDDLDKLALAIQDDCLSTPGHETVTARGLKV